MNPENPMQISDAAARLETILSHVTLGVVALIVLLLQVLTLHSVAPETLADVTDVVWIGVGAGMVYTVLPYIIIGWNYIVTAAARWYYGGETA